MKLPIPFFIYLFSCCLPVIAGIARIRRTDGAARFYLLILEMGLFFTLAEIYVAMHFMHNLWLINLYILLYVCMISLIFSSWTPPGIIRTGLRWFSAAFALYWIIAKLSFEALTAWPNYTSTVMNILCIIVPTYLLVGMNRDSTHSRYSGFRFWTLAGILFLAAGDLLLFAFGSQLIALTSQQAVIYNLHWIVSSVANTLFVLGFLSLREKDSGIEANPIPVIVEST